MLGLPLYGRIMHGRLPQLYVGITANAHFQGYWVHQVKIRIAAEPALAVLCGKVFFSGGESWAALPGPYTAARFWLGQAFPTVEI